MILLWRGSYRYLGSWQTCRSTFNVYFATCTLPVDAFKLIIATLCLALSFPLLAQTILHLPNFSTLPMLVVRSSLVPLTDHRANYAVFREPDRVDCFKVQLPRNPEAVLLLSVDNVIRRLYHRTL